MAVSAADSVWRIAELSAVARARAQIVRTDARTLDEQCAIARIASPPFGEAVRAAWVQEQFHQAGLAAVRRDDAGNVLGEKAGTAGGSEPVILAAHLDTVFPAETQLELREEGRRLLLPGIADNARGLAGMLAIVRALLDSNVVTRRPLVFVASVGEEGVGDLRGMKHLFRAESPLRRAAGFIALDGTESRRIVTRAVGSVRFRLRIHGPGGHSWADRGAANPAHALGAAIAALSRLRLPEQPAWALNVGRMGGGTSVNAIPAEAWLELDLRSEDAPTLRVLEQRAQDALNTAVRESSVQRRRGTPPLRLEVIPIGDRPAGHTPPESALAQSARAATRYIGRRPELVSSSTDANVPMSLGIPAIAIGAGGESGGMHTLNEWYENRRGPEGIVRALLTLLLVAGVA